MQDTLESEATKPATSTLDLDLAAESQGHECRWRRRAHRAAQALSRWMILFTLILICTANITNSFLLDCAFRDLPSNSQKWGLIAAMNGAAYRPFAYRALPAEAIQWLATRLYAKWPSSLATVENLELHYHYFSKISDQRWTSVVSISYALMYFAIVLAMAGTLYWLYCLARLRGLSYPQALGVLAVFSFILPFFFQRHGFYYDFFELCGVFAACYFFLRGWMLVSTLTILAASFVKETFFLVPFAFYFLHDEATPRWKRFSWLGAQFACSIAGRLTIMHAFEHNAGAAFGNNFFINLAYWIRADLWIGRWQTAFAPALFLPHFELYAIPAALAFRFAWNRSEPRLRRYFLAAVVPLAILYAFFGYQDELRVFILAFPAAALILFKCVGRFGEIFGCNSAGEQEAFHV